MLLFKDVVIDKKSDTNFIWQADVKFDVYFFFDIDDLKLSFNDSILKS